jgi:U3 small nucleolar RNA-associated protein 4
VYTSGVDQKITQFTYIKTSTSGTSSVLNSSSRWVQTCSRRMHSHDVRALAIWPPYTLLPPSHKRKFPTNIAPILASGGLDMSVVLTPAAPATSTVVTKVVNPLSTSVAPTFEDSYHRRLAYTSGASALRVARQARLVCCARDDSLSIWRILQRQETPPDDTLQERADSAGWEKVLDIELNVHTNIIASAISDDGNWLVVSDLYETKLFALESDVSALLSPLSTCS